MTRYKLAPDAKRRLDSLVDRIEAAPGSLCDPREFEELAARMDLRGVLSSLPEGMSEDDLVGVLKLAMLTECATELYADAISIRARRFDAAWLARFNERVWTPDELTHAEPFRLILLGLGFSEEELDREIRETQDRQFEHLGGDTPVHVSTFGMIQEYLTDHWHGMIARLLRRSSPAAAYMANRIKKRETLHTIWYRDMTALQLESNPDFVFHVSDELARFRLPGNSLIPELQSQAERWLQLMNADFARLLKDLVRLLATTVSTPRQAGRLAIDLADRKGVSLGPIRAEHLRGAMERLGGWGYGLVGEAILERAGLSFMFRAQDGEGRFRPETGVSARVRTLLRRWLASQIPLSLVPR